LIKNHQEQQEIITILIRDGYSIDILGCTELLPVNVLKDFLLVDPHLFDSEETHLNLPDLQQLELYSQTTPSANDSNSLNKNFYHELLHIIGLTEVKEGSKKLIQRKPIKE
ncbi:MAG: hypothetical protein ACKPE3_05025, partial [Sphaerospermopsis kisseleviana]